ncbi:MAG: nicotinate (nicotinamide) nucleotide adenylyltransferase [Armatimonadetes bacterium]|nr:nicotinate (nicotinamide) nucleotide adenylyltransferase [Armatimonadota bacterium]
MRIGILGGTFDPPHSGHLALAEAALSQLRLEEVLFVPAHKNPAKLDQAVTPAKMRLEMVRLAILGRQEFSVSDIEVVRRGPSYAVDTMLQLAQASPSDYWFLMGADALKGLPNWKQPEKLIRLCRLGVAVRAPDQPDEVISRLPEAFRSKVDIIKLKPQDVSSSEIREYVSRGLGVGQWLPEAVQSYVLEHKLYRS